MYNCIAIAALGEAVFVFLGLNFVRADGKAAKQYGIKRPVWIFCVILDHIIAMDFTIHRNFFERQ